MKAKNVTRQKIEDLFFTSRHKKSLVLLLEVDNFNLSGSQQMQLRLLQYLSKGISSKTFQGAKLDSFSSRGSVTLQVAASAATAMNTRSICPLTNDPLENSFPRCRIDLSKSNLTRSSGAMSWVIPEPPADA